MVAVIVIRMTELSTRFKAANEIISKELELLATLQLSSPALPIGGFSYSQGLESAVVAGLVSDENSLSQWVGQGLQFSFGLLELPVWCLQYRHWQQPNTAGHTAAFELDDWFLAARETEELRLETEQMGWSAQALLRDWSGEEKLEVKWDQLLARRPVSLPTVMSALAVFERISLPVGALGFCFSWVEGQVMAGSKAIPLGQAAIQRVIRAQREQCVSAVSHAMTMKERDLQTFSPGLAILSSQHETLYTRLYRS